MSVVADGTVWGGQEWYDNRWSAIPEETRRRMVDHLRANVSGRVFEDVQAQHGDRPTDFVWPFHFGTGVTVRNLLREVVKDDELPDAPYPDGRSYRNMDDVYMQALEAAFGRRAV